MAAWSEEIVWVLSEDHLRLEGVVTRPTTAPARPTAVVQVHGFTARFSTPTHILLGRRLAEHGYLSVAGNNRGVHLGVITGRRDGSGEQVVVGAGWERFMECPLDIGAWTDFAAGLGFERIVLLGHSFGGPKVVYYQAQRQDPRVVGLALASPGSAHAGQPRFSVSPEIYDLAERMVAEGRGRDLLPWGSYGGSPTGAISAQTCLDWAPAHRAEGDVFGVFTENPVVGRIRCPILAFYGTDEPSEGGPAELERIRRGATAAAVETHMLTGADHSYTGRESEVADVVAAWLDTLG